MRASAHMCATAVTLSLLLAPCVGFAAHHESETDPSGAKPWNQEVMADLTAQLSSAMREVRRAFRREPAFRDQNSPNRHAVMQMDQTLMQLERSCSQLANRVAGGGNAADTVQIARRIGVLLNDADMWGRRIRGTESMQARVKPAADLLNQIAPFYGSEPLFDPETLERVDRAPNPDRRQPDSAKPESESDPAD